MQTELWSHPNPSIRDRKRGWHATASLLLRKQAYVGCDIHGFPGPLFKPLNHLEHISHTFYNILTQFPLPFHHRLPVRAKDSHKQILWSVSQKGSTCRVRSQSLLFLSRRTPLPIMNLQSNLGRIEKAHLKNKWPLFEMPVLQVGGWVWNLTAEQYGKVAFY